MNQSQKDLAVPVSLWNRLIWLIGAGSLFFLSYGFANDITSQLTYVPSVFFQWEKHIPLWPWTIIPYWSLDLLYVLAFFLPQDKKGIKRLGLRLVSVQLIATVCFLLWPLTFSFERPHITGFFSFLFDLLMSFDQPYNQAPSLHVAISIILATEFHHRFKGSFRWFLHGWFALIVISVLTTWQHHFIDIPSGIIAGALALWLWPRSTEHQIFSRAVINTQHFKMTAIYGGLSLTLLFFALPCNPVIFFLLMWAALSLILVAGIYGFTGPKGFQKSPDGQLSTGANILLFIYLCGAKLNIYYWTRKHAAFNEVIPNIFLGRLPSNRTAYTFEGILDLCAELPFPKKFRKKKQIYYTHIPFLDLTLPSEAACMQAVYELEQLSQKGKVLVCCALGYSRSALVIAAWLTLTNKVNSLDKAVSLIRQARPQIVLKPEALSFLERLIKNMSPSLFVSEATRARSSSTGENKQRVLIIGGTSGLGLGLGIHYLSNGFQVTLCGRHLSKIPEYLKKQYPDLSCRYIDVTSQPSIINLFESIKDSPLHLFIYSAGHYFSERRLTLDKTQSDTVLSVNLEGFQQCFEHASKLMRHQGYGHLVSIAAIAGLLRSPARSLYSQTKRAVISITESYRIALQPYNIDVTAIAPGYINTPQLRRLTQTDTPHKLFIVSQQRAVNEVTQAILKTKSLHAFPWRMRSLIFAVNHLLPSCLTGYITTHQKKPKSNSKNNPTQ